MAIVLLYTVLLCYLIYRLPFFRLPKTPRAWVLVFFLIKVGASFLYVHLHKTVLHGGDIFEYYKDSGIIFSALKENIVYYLQLTFGFSATLPEPQHLMPYIEKMSFWYDKSTYLLVRINAVIRLFSFGSFTVHVLIFTFFSFVGLIGLFHFFRKYFQEDLFWLYMILFFVPSEIFWYSGLHKEAPLICSLGLMFYSFNKVFVEKDFKVVHSLILLISLIVILLSRTYVFIALFACMIPFIISINREHLALKIYLGSFLLLFFLGISIMQSNANINLFEEIKIRQEHFINSPGNTSFPIPPIGDNMLSLIKNIPNGILNLGIRPLPTDCIKSNFWCFLAMIESYFFLALIIYCGIRIQWKNLTQNNIALFCLSFTLFVSIVIGLIVNNAGAMVRYKSIILPFLLVGLYFASRKAKKVSI